MQSKTKTKRVRPTDIKIGDTYRNRGAGKAWRKVLDIGNHCRPDRWLSGGMSLPPDEPGVLFVDSKDREEKLYISSFAAWCGEKVEADLLSVETRTNPT